MHHTLLDDDVDHHAPLSELLYQLSQTKDGHITASAATPGQQVGLLTAIDRLDLFADPRFDSIEKILANVDAFRAELQAGIAEMATDELLQALGDNDVPAARPLDYHEVLAHPQYEANDSHDVATHPRMGSMVRVKPPARFDGERTEPAAHCPAHGEHTVEILTALGMTPADIGGLLDNGIVSALES
jgi:crotonobetainyl-CoA:carnitine CoA-transferase CaiB-like acyl-CoA transferase